jgi:hypothetical protein
LGFFLVHRDGGVDAVAAADGGGMRVLESQRGNMKEEIETNIASHRIINNVT